VARLAGAFGLNPKPAASAAAAQTPAPASPTPTPANTATPSPASPPKASQQVTGMQLKRVQPPSPADLPSLWFALLPALLAFAVGGWRQTRAT
jgi:hypothetical protein